MSMRRRAVVPPVAPPNKRMKLTRLVAAPGRQDKVPPRAPAGGTGRTASQLMRRVRPTHGGAWRTSVVSTGAGQSHRRASAGSAQRCLAAGRGSAVHGRDRQAQSGSWSPTGLRWYAMEREPRVVASAAGDEAVGRAGGHAQDRVAALVAGLGWHGGWPNGADGVACGRTSA